MSIGSNIKKMRALKEMTLSDVAKKIGVSKQTIQRYESGVISNIPFENVEKIAQALSTTPAFLMGWEDETGNFIPLSSDDEISGLDNETKQYIDKLPKEAIEELNSYVKLLYKAYLKKP